MTREEIIFVQLNEIRNGIILQIGSFMFASAAFLLFTFAIPFIIFNFRRTALVFTCLASAVAFLVPTPLTLWFSPAGMILSIAGIIILREKSDPKPQVKPTQVLEG